MKIVFTGGGTGGHFYPIIAVAQQINKIIDNEKISGIKLYYLSTSPYDPEALFENNIIFEKIDSGKMRTYFSFRNFFDIFKIISGIFRAIFKLYSIYPDVIFSKGGYGSFPTLVAAKILKIPTIIHESDSTPGRVNKWSGKFADKIALSFSEASEYFPKNKIAWTGNPIRLELEEKASKENALEYFKLESNLPTILILGGSQGAELINNTILDALPRLIQKYQIIHQTGVLNFKNNNSRAEVILMNEKNKNNYLTFSFLNPLQMKMAAGTADLIISRAGSTLFEISNWGIPSILIPFTKSNADHAKKNAFTYARAGGCIVIEELNMKANILASEVERILNNEELYKKMSSNALNFHKKGAAEKIARELLGIVLSHQK